MQEATPNRAARYKDPLNTSDANIEAFAFWDDTFEATQKNLLHDAHQEVILSMSSL